jgi:hypothetical protein
VPKAQGKKTKAKADPPPSAKGDNKKATTKQATIKKATTKQATTKKARRPLTKSYG